MADKIELRKIREFGEIISDTFTFIRQNFKPLVKVFIYLCGFFVLAGMLAAIMQQIGLQKVVGGIDPNNPFSGGNFLNQIFTFNYFLVVIFSVANYAAINVAVLSYIALYVEKGKVAPSVEEVWAYFKYYFFRVLGSSVVVTLFMVICLVACIAPFIYVFPAMSLFFPIMILENANFEFSFNKGFKLLKNQWLATAGTLFVVWIITYACMSFVALPGVILTLMSTLVEHKTEISSGIIIFTTVLQYAAQIFMIVPFVAIALCYFNLVERKESTGLMDRLNQFGKQETDFKSQEEY